MDMQKLIVWCSCNKNRKSMVFYFAFKPQVTVEVLISAVNYNLIYEI